MARHHQPDRRTVRFRTVIIFVIIAILAVFAYFRIADRDTGPDMRGDLAQCLTDKGVKMYGAYWCPHCQAQKKAFGAAFKKVNYVECAIPGDPRAQTQECKDAKIEGYPTWVFPDGTRRSGEITLVSLAEQAGCQYPGAKLDSASAPVPAPAPAVNGPVGPRVDVNAAP
ncbi:MAG TPA: hypothetical protein VLC10_00670 [Patescibacteria group bacterium]|nr:hypothetical protein [Patescibacteria group bacterium]